MSRDKIDAQLSSETIDILLSFKYIIISFAVLVYKSAQMIYYI